MNLDLINVIKDVGISSVVVAIALAIFWKMFNDTYPTLTKIETSLREERELVQMLENINSSYSQSITEITDSITSFQHSNELLVESLKHINETLIDVRHDMRDDRKTHYDLMRIQEEILKTSYLNLELTRGLCRTIHGSDDCGVNMTKAELEVRDKMDEHNEKWGRYDE